MSRLQRVGGVAASASVALAAMLLALGSRDAGGFRDPVEQDGWSAEAILCAYREPPDDLSALRRGEVLSLGNDATDVLDQAQCTRGTTRSDRDRPPVIDADHSHFVLSTGGDRIDVALVGVGTDVSPAELVAELSVVGDSCGQTAEYRGQLMLLIEGPAGEPTPTVTLDEVALEC